MKKVLLWMVVVAVAISLASVLSLGSCKAEEEMLGGRTS